MDYLSTIVPAIADGLQVTLKIFVITIAQPALGDYYGHGAAKSFSRFA